MTWHLGIGWFSVPFCAGIFEVTVVLRRPRVWYRISCRSESSSRICGERAPQGFPPAAKAKMSAPVRRLGGCWTGGSFVWVVMAGSLKFVGTSARGWSPLSGGRRLLIRGRFLGLGLAELVVRELESCSCNRQ